jgi:hypothetical protein
VAISATPNSPPPRNGCLAPEARAEAWLDRSPYPVVPESPTIGIGIPHQVSPRRPRWWRWLRRRPRRRGSPRSPADQAAWSTLVGASRTLPVVTVIRVQVVAPTRIPWITRAPVRVGRRRRRRLGDAASRPESEHGQTTTGQHACAEPNPRSRSPHGTHNPIISFAAWIPQRFGDTATFRGLWPNRRPSGDWRGSEPAEEFGLVLGELLVGEDAALMQPGERLNGRDDGRGIISGRGGGRLG